MHIYTKICYILLTPSLSKIFFRSINIEYDANKLIFNNQLQLIYMSSSDNNGIVIYEPHMKNVNTIILLIMEQLLFTNNMEINIETREFVASSIRIFEIKIDLYRIFDPLYGKNVWATQMVPSIDVFLYLLQTIQIVKSRCFIDIQNVNAFNISTIRNIANSETYTNFIAYTEVNPGKYMIFDYVNNIGICYYYISELKRHIITSVKVYQSDEFTSRENDIRSVKINRPNWKLIDISVDKDICADKDISVGKDISAEKMNIYVEK